jgi:MYXO-CTERM domain-containing protein
MKNYFVVVLGVAAIVATQCQRANAGLVPITVQYLPDLVTVPGHATPTYSADGALAEASQLHDQGTATLFSWLLNKENWSGVGPKPLNHMAKSGNGGNLGDLTTYLSKSYAGDYLVVHWGKGDAGGDYFSKDSSKDSGGFEQAFYISKTAGGTLTLPTFSGWYQKGNTVKDGTDIAVGGLSGWTVFGMPEPTTAIAGIGALGLVVLGALGRVRRSVFRIG